MKKMGIIFLAIVFCFMLCACGKGFSERLFKDDGIYQEYDQLSKEEQEEFLREASKKGYAVSFDTEGRLILTKDGKTLVLGESKK